MNTNEQRLLFQRNWQNQWLSVGAALKQYFSPNLTETNSLTFHLHQPKSNEQLLSWTSPPFTLNDQYKMALKADYSEPSRSSSSAERRSTINVTMSLYLLKQESDAEFVKSIYMHHDIDIKAYNSHNHDIVNVYAASSQSQSQKSTFQLCNMCNSNLDMPEIILQDNSW